jgi:hypothetical protein
MFAYLPRWSYFGEQGPMGLDKNSTTCTALDQGDLVGIQSADFAPLL